MLIITVFCGALVASWTILRRCLPFPEVPVVREKIEHLGRYGDNYEILFVGSSRIYFQVLPSIFDPMMRDHGITVRSFNAGIAAIRPPEDGYYLEQVLRNPHRRLRWVFLELMGLNPKPDPTLTSTRRSSYWHDWERTRMLSRRCVLDCASAWQRARQHEVSWSEAWQSASVALDAWRENLGLFVENFSSFGRGETLLRQRFGTAKERKNGSKEEPADWDGWAFPSIAKPWTEDPKRRTAYEEAYGNLLAVGQRFESSDPVSWDSLKAKLSAIEQAGATPILIIPPTLALKRYFPPATVGRLPVVFDFSDPREHPELFAIDHRLDGQHLNDKGAEIFTNEIGQRFIELLEKNGRTP